MVCPEIYYESTASVLIQSLHSTIEVTFWANEDMFEIPNLTIVYHPSPKHGWKCFDGMVIPGSDL